MKPLKIFLTMLATMAIMAFVSSCDDDEEEVVKGSISVSPTYITFEMEGGTETVTVTANAPWTVDGPEWIEVNPDSGTGDSGVLITVPDNTDEESVTRSGTLTFSLKSGSGKASVGVYQPGNDPVQSGGHGAGSDGVMKILSIGNSFAVDGVEQNLWDLFNAAGIEAEIGNMYIGDSTPETHYNNAVSNSAAYSYRKIVNGVMTTKSSVTMLYGIEDNDWDYICFTTSGWQSALYDSKYVPFIPYLLSYAKSNATNPEMEVALNQVWAYPEDSTDSNYLNYFSGQMDMYNSIIAASQRALEDFDVDILVPCGTAVQNGRNTYLGDTFNRDGRHLNYTYGRFTAACAWFETFSGVDVTTNSYTPADIDDAIKDLTVHAAHFAVENPYEINPMVDWQDDPRPHVVQVREIATYATSATVAWNVGGCSEEEASAYAYTAKLYNDEDCTDLRVSWKFDARSGSASTDGSSVWKPGNVARVWFTFADLEPETDYWVKVNITDDESSCNEEPFKFTTTASFGTSINVVSENAQAGDVILMENFDKLIHGGDPANKAAGVYPTSSNRSTLARLEGETPSSFSKDKWHSTGLGPFPHSYSNVKEAYTEAVGLSDWCVGTSSQGTTVTTRPGYIKVGRTNYMGYLATPEFKAIPEGKTATIRVEFKAMPYYYGSSYCNYIVMGIVNRVETDEYHQVASWTTSADNGEVEDKREITVTQEEGVFHDYSVDFSNITNNSRIRFSSYNSSKGAFMLDDIVITVLSVEDIQYSNLAVPTNVKIDDTSDSGFSISWDGVTGADSYTVKYWAEGNEAGALTESTYDTSLAVSYLTANTTYYAQVMACSNGGEEYNSDYSDAVSCTTGDQQFVYLSLLDAHPTTVSVKWNVDNCGEQDATYFAYDFAIYRDEACDDMIVKWSSDAATGSGNSESVWRPGTTARVRFTFAGLESSTDYWVKVNIQGNPASAATLKVSTTEPFGSGLTVVSENAKAGDVILVEGFDKLVHGRDALQKGVSVIPSTSNRTTLVIPEGDNPSEFSLMNWHVTNDVTSDFSPFYYTKSGCVGTAYTEAVGLSDWCTGVTTSGYVITTRPGYIMMGMSSYLGYLATPELSAIPEGKTAKVKVDFQAMPYNYSSYRCDQILVGVADNVVPDANTRQVSDWGSSSDKGVLTASEIVPLTQSDASFLDYSVEFEGVTSGSRIRFSSQNTGYPTFMLDNIVITVVEVQ